MTTGIDLALASMADVSILTYGSYVNFGALLTKTKDVYFPKNHPAHNTNGLNLGIPGFYGIPWDENEA